MKNIDVVNTLASNLSHFSVEDAKIKGTPDNELIETIKYLIGQVVDRCGEEMVNHPECQNDSYVLAVKSQIDYGS